MCGIAKNVNDLKGIRFTQTDLKHAIFFEGNLADRERAKVLSIVILDRLKDHQAVDHEPGIAYEGAPIRH